MKASEHRVNAHKLYIICNALFIFGHRCSVGELNRNWLPMAAFRTLLLVIEEEGSSAWDGVCVCVCVCVLGEGEAREAKTT